MFFTLFIYTAGLIDINQNGFYLQPQYDAPLSSTVNGLQRTYNTNTIKWKVNNTQIIMISENNNTTKEISFTPSVSTTSDIELRGSGIRWSGKVEIIYTERNY